MTNTKYMTDLPKRKRLRLENYDYSANGAYFITICTKNNDCPLSKIVGHDAHIVPQIQLTKTGEIIKKHIELITGIDCYIIMPNHIHMIIVKQNDNNGAMWASRPTRISDDIRSFKTVVTKELGCSIWQTSFYDHIIRNEEDYLIHLQYIEENPRKWLMGKDEYYS